MLPAAAILSGLRDCVFVQMSVCVPWDEMGCRALLLERKSLSLLPIQATLHSHAQSSP